MKKCTIGTWSLVAVIMASGTAAGMAQNTGALDQLETSRQRRDAQEFYREGEQVDPLFPGETSDVGPQIILKKRTRPTHFEVMLDSQFFYNSNVFFEEPGGNEDTTVLVNTAQFALAPEPYAMGDGSFAPRIGYRHQWFFYGLDDDRARLKNNDFNVQTVFMDGRYRFAENWVFDAGVEWNRLLGYSDYDEFYKEISPRIGLRRLFPITEDLTFSLGARTHYRWTDSDIFLDDDELDRLDHVALATLNYAVTDRLDFQPYYRFQYSDYLNQHRNDFIHTIGCGLHYALGRNWMVRAFAAYDLRESTRPEVADYRRFDIGGGVNFVFRF